MSGNSGNTMGEKETAEKSLRCLRDQTQTATPSTSRDLHAAAADIAGMVVDSLDELVESRMTDGRRDSVTSIIQSLDDFSSESRSDVLAGGSRSAPFTLFRRERGSQSQVSLPNEPVSGFQSSRDQSEDQPVVEAELGSGSILSVRSPPQTTYARFRLHLDSCADRIITRVVELYKSELLLSSSSRVSPHVSTSLPEQPSVNVPTTNRGRLLTEAAQAVGDILTGSLTGLELEPSSSSTPSESSSDVQDASDRLAEAVIDNLARYLEAVRSEMEDQDRRLKNIFRLADTSLPRDQMTAARIRSSSPFFVFTRMKYMLEDHLRRAGEQRSDSNSFSETTVDRRPTTSSSSPPYPESETTSHHEDDIISDSGTVTITPSQSQQGLSQSPGPSHASPNNAGSVIEMETQEAGTCPSVPVEKSSRGFFCIFGKRAGMVRFRQVRNFTMNPSFNINTDFNIRLHVPIIRGPST